MFPTNVVFQNFKKIHFIRRCCSFVTMEISASGHRQTHSTVHDLFFIEFADTYKEIMKQKQLISTRCRPYVLPLLCHTQFPYCGQKSDKSPDSSNLVQLCQQDCLRLQNDICQTEYLAARKDSFFKKELLPNCSKLPRKYCVRILSGSKSWKGNNHEQWKRKNGFNHATSKYNFCFLSFLILCVEKPKSCEAERCLMKDGFQASYELPGSLRNQDGNGNCNAMVSLFQNFRLKRFLVFCSNLLPVI